MALSNLFSKKGKYYDITKKVLLALRLLKKFDPPSFTEIRWKSLSECTSFIEKKSKKLNNIIDQRRQYKGKVYDDLKKFDWKGLNNALCIIMSYIIRLESDEMRIEYVYGELTRTIHLLETEKTEISNALSTELINVYTENGNLKVSLSAFLLTY